jgi:probable F420-dependent oxidoreductase
MDLGPIGVWSGTLRNSERSAVCEAAVELEELGYSTIWFPGGAHEGIADHITAILAATKEAKVATGISSIWTHPPLEVAREHHEINQAFPDRFMLGLGISHQSVVERSGLTYEKPMAKLISYLDELDAAPIPVPVDERILASLGPRSLQLAKNRASGTHPYFVPVEHTRAAREAVGPDKHVAPELMVVLEPDADKARAIARPTMDRYLHAPNYVSNLKRLGFTDADIENGGSDRLVDAIIAWGTPDAIRQRIEEQYAAGADHVCIQVLTGGTPDLAASMAGWRQLSPLVRAG